MRKAIVKKVDTPQLTAVDYLKTQAEIKTLLNRIRLLSQQTPAIAWCETKEFELVDVVVDKEALEASKSDASLYVGKGYYLQTGANGRSYYKPIYFRASEVVRVEEKKE